MSAEVRDHYENLLAEHYSWMLGDDFEAVVARQRALLADLVADRRRGTALDLGCGSGAQALAVADLGFAPIVALDLSPTLIDELAERSAAVPAIEGRVADMTAGLSEVAAPNSVALVTCMGDTLPHLSEKRDVRRLFAEVGTVLEPGGLFVLSLRDLSVILTGLDRFVPVRADDSTIMTCFLEDEGEHVRVHDLIHDRDVNGTWTTRTSSYRKLRLKPDWVVSALADAGFGDIDVDTLPSGLTVISSGAGDARGRRARGVLA